MAYFIVPRSRYSAWDDPFAEIERSLFSILPRAREPEVSLADRKWKQGFKLGDFSPEQVKVKVDDDRKVIIVARHSEGNDEWGDVVERRRVVKIPENVDAEKVHSVMRSDGTLIIEAPYVDKQERQLAIVQQDSSAVVPSDGQTDLMKFSVGKFNPDEVQISCKEGVLSVKGERQRTEDNHEVRESFFRQMTVPDSVDVGNIKCFRDADGNLTIRAPSLKKDEDEKSENME